MAQTLQPLTWGQGSGGGGGGGSGNFYANEGAAPTSGGGGGGFLHYLFHNPVTDIAEKTISGLAEDAINLPAGLVTGGGMLLHHPGQFGEAFLKGLYQPFEHPLRNPDQTILSALALLPIPGSAFARAADVTSILGREGALTAELSDAGKIEASGLSPRAYAESIGKGDQYSRIMGTDSLPRSVNSQVWTSLLHGPALEERLLKTSTGDLKRGADYSKNPSIKAAQKMIDRMYERFPDGKPPPYMRIIPGFQRTQVQRLNAASKAAQTIEKNLARKNGAVFLKKWAGKLTPEQEMAVRMVGEMTTKERLTAYHEGQLSGAAEGEGVRAPETQARIKLVTDANQYLKNKTVRLSDGTKYEIPVLRDDAPSFMHDYLKDASNLSNEQQTALHEGGVLPEESLLNRLLAPFHMVNFGGEPPPSIAKLEREFNQQKNLGNTEKAAEIKSRLDALRKQWEPPEEGLPPPGKARFEEDIPPPGPTRAEQKLAEEMDRLKREGGRGAAARMQEIEAHQARIHEGQLGPNLEEVPHDMTVAQMRELRDIGNPFYIPYKAHEPDKTGFGFTAFRKSFRFTGRATPPSRITHAYEGKLLKTGGGRTDVTKMLYENHSEGLRYITLMKHYKAILASARDTPEGIPEGHARLIRDLTNLKAGEIPYEKAAQYAKVQDDLLKGNLTPEAAGGTMFEGIRNWIFPDMETIKAKLGIGEGDEWRPVPGYKWVDDRTLGYLDKQNPLFSALSSPMVRRVVKGFDAINTIQKDMILYLKPAYAFPNAFGNLFLNAIQQGLWAPANLAKSYRLFSKLKPETIEKVDQSMGGGFAEALKSPGFTGGVHRASNWVANLYGKGVDTPFRRASFMHEARLSGFRTSDEIERLLSDPELHDTVERIARRANEEILNYERMGPGEQAVLRRLVFFYPWLKASSRYVSYLAKNHPLAAGLTGDIGQMGKGHIENMLGALPSFEEGLIPYGGVHGPPWLRTALTMNPSSAAILQEPADLAQILMNVLKRNPNLNLDAFSNLTPVDRGALALGTAGKVSTLKHPVGQPIWQTALNEVVGGNPLIGGPTSLIEHLTGGKTYPGSIHPYNDKTTALLRFLVFGSLYPTLTNVNQLNWDAWKQNNQTGFTGG